MYSKELNNSTIKLVRNERFAGYSYSLLDITIDIYQQFIHKAVRLLHIYGETLSFTFLPPEDILAVLLEVYQISPLRAPAWRVDIHGALHHILSLGYRHGIELFSK